jgi:hypothetical protein
MTNSLDFRRFFCGHNTPFYHGTEHSEGTTVLEATCPKRDIKYRNVYGMLDIF